MICKRFRNWSGDDRCKQSLRLLSAFVFSYALICQTNAQTLLHRSSSNLSVAWDSTHLISDSTQFHPYNLVVLNGNNIIHLFWQDEQTALGDVKYVRSTDGGKTFSKDTILVEAHPGAALVTPEGFSYGVSGNFVYLETTDLSSPTQDFQSLMRSTNSGATWDTLTRVGQMVWPGFCGALAVEDSLLFQFVTDIHPSDTMSTLRRSSDYGVSWQTLGQMSGFMDPGRLAVASSYLHGIEDWSHDYGIILYRHSSDLGQTWGPVDTISAQIGLSSAQDGVISTSEDRYVYIVWDDDKYGSDGGESVLFRKSGNNGNTWEPEQSITPTPTAETPVVASSGSYVCVAWNQINDPLPANTQLRVSTDYGSTWSDVITVNDSGYGYICLKDSLLSIFWIDHPYTASVFYRQGIITNITGVQEKPLPNAIWVSQNFPNPFNPTTKIQYSLEKPEHVTIKIFDILGREVAAPVDAVIEPGLHTITLDLSHYASGVYYYRFQAGSFVRTKKLVVMK